MLEPLSLKFVFLEATEDIISISDIVYISSISYKRVGDLLYFQLTNEPFRLLDWYSMVSIVTCSIVDTYQLEITDLVFVFIHVV